MRLEESSRPHQAGNTYRKKFSKSGIRRRTVISSSCTKYEAKEAEKSKTTTHL
jgi:hypothetical protein